MKIRLLLLCGLVALPLGAATSKSLRKNSAPGAAAKQPAVTLDVKDEDVRSIHASMQKQCGIRNLVVDPKVEARGTFFFRDVPCTTAFKAVLESLSLTSTTYGNSVVSVGKTR